MVQVDRERARRAFAEYVRPYDAENPRISLKVAHTYRVAAIGERIARAEGLPVPEVDLAWLCCLLHDIGRFEQLRRWDTFSDARSASHPAIGVAVLFGASASADAGAGDPGDSPTSTGAFPFPVNAPELPDSAPVEHPTEPATPGSGRIESFIASRAEDALIRAAVGYHSDFRLPAELDSRTRLFCNIVRDADKVDIFRTSGVENTPMTVMGSTEEEFLASELSEDARRAFLEHRTLARNERHTPLDMHAGTIALAFELVFPESMRIAREQGYLERACQTPFGIERPFARPETRAAWAELTGELFRWLAEHNRG